MRLTPPRPRSLVELGAAFGMSVSELRACERRRLTPELRWSLSEHRRYMLLSRRLQVIAMLRQAGLCLDVIAEVLRLGDLSASGAQVEFAQAALEDRRRGMERQQAALRLAMAALQGAGAARQPLDEWLAGVEQVGAAWLGAA